MKDLYIKYAGKEVTSIPDSDFIEPGVFKGIICGYSNSALIIAVTKRISGPWDDGYHEIYSETIITHKDNELGYWSIVPEQLPKLD